MTRSEAIDMLRQICSYLTAGSPVWRTEPIREACDMAIEALTAEPTQTNAPNALNALDCVDTISRQALMELFDWWEHEYDEIDSYLRNMRQDVLTLPTTGEMVARKITEEANKACAECQEYVCDECEYRHWRGDRR